VDGDEVVSNRCTILLEVVDGNMEVKNLIQDIIAF
jgi:hypothetical protein